MNTKLLEDVLVLLEERNFSRAAARRGVTQPAFSRRVRAFEEWIGITLLDRTANRVDLHPRLLASSGEIRETLARIDLMRRRLRDGSNAARQIVLVTQHAMAASIVADVIGAFRAAEPAVTVRMRTMNRADCVSYFMHGEADVLMIYEARHFPPLPFDATIRRRTWLRDTLIPVCGGALRHAMDPEGRAREPFPMISYPLDSHFGRLIVGNGFDENMRADGGESVVETAFSVGALNLACAGVGVAWVPHAMCHRSLAAGTLLSLAKAYGQIPLDVDLFSTTRNTDFEQIIDRLSHG